jgi:two-component system, NarL family, sensor histidine kinase UhpB
MPHLAPEPAGTASGGTDSELAGLLEFVQQAADAERAALARALHDELGGVLVSMKMQLAALAQAAGASELQPHLEKLRRSLAAAIALRQQLEEQLQPGLLVHVGLFAALRSYAEQVVAAGAPLHVELPAGELPLLPGVRIVLYRALVSALTHLSAGATNVRLRGSIAGPLLEIVIQRSGDSASATPPGAALKAAERRIEFIGGSLACSAELARLRLPLRAPLLQAVEK